MRKSEIKVGGVYEARVSGRIVPVRVEGSMLGELGRNHRHRVLNLATGHRIRVSSARLRCPLVIVDATSRYRTCADRDGTCYGTDPSWTPPAPRAPRPAAPPSYPAYETIIGLVVAGVITPQRGEDLVSLRMAVERQVICGCGRILDVRTAVYTETVSGQPVGVACPACDPDLRGPNQRFVTWGGGL